MRIITIVLLIVNSSISAQEGFLMHDHNISQSEIEARVLRLNKKAIDNLDSVKLGLYYMHKSSLYLYSGRDSSFHYLQKALDLNPKNVCGVLWRVKGLQHIKNQEEWFIPDLQIEGIDSIMIDKCGQKWIDAERIFDSENQKSKIYSSELAEQIMKSDQKYRVNEDIDWNKQNTLDSLNRVLLDSLYLAKGSLEDFTKEEMDAFSFVIHHSADCYWNLRWFELWLYEYNEGNINGGGILIGPAFNRMLMSEDAYCTEKLPSLSRVFLERIRNKFPKEMGLKFGYTKTE